MSENQTKKPRGRRVMSPEGKRIVVHMSLSPEAHRALTALCDRPIAPIAMSAMMEHLILTAADQLENQSTSR